MRNVHSFFPPPQNLQYKPLSTSHRNEGGHVVVQWLRHYATSRKVAGSRPNEANEYLQIYLIHVAALGPGVYSALAEMSTRSRKIMFL
jgi:hypothetical protein